MEEGKPIPNVYEVTIPASHTGDVKVVLKAAVATFNSDYNTYVNNLTMSGGQNVTYGTTATITVTPGAKYYVPDAENVEVYMNDKLVEGAYVINSTTDADGKKTYQNSATITVPKVTGDIVVKASAKVKIDATATVTGLVTEDEGTVVLKATYDSVNVADTTKTKYYDPATKQAIDIELGLANVDNDYNAVKYTIDEITVDSGSNISNVEDYSDLLDEKQGDLETAQILYANSKITIDDLKAAEDAYNAAYNAAYYSINGNLVTLYNVNDYVTVSATVVANTTTETVATNIDTETDSITAYEALVGTTKCYEVLASDVPSITDAMTLKVERTVTNASGTPVKTTGTITRIKNGTTTVGYRITGFTSYDGLTITATTPASGS